MSSRAVLIVYVAAALVAALVTALITHTLLPLPVSTAAPLAPSSAAPSPAVSPQIIAQPAPPPPVIGVPADPATIKPPAYLTFFGWALLDRKTSVLTGSDNRDSSTNTTESMIKVWIAADYLRHHAAPSATEQDELRRMIIHSDDILASKYYNRNGADASITELIQLCGLRSSGRPSRHPGMWSNTMMSPADAVRLGECVATNKVTDPNWTKWLLKAMHDVTGGVADQISVTQQGGRWGIIDGLPAASVAGVSIKNGWTPQGYDHRWHINCLAIHPDWVLAIELQYPWTSPDGTWQHSNNLQPGADACRAVTRQLWVYPDL